MKTPSGLITVVSIFCFGLDSFTYKFSIAIVSSLLYLIQNLNLRLWVILTTHYGYKFETDFLYKIIIATVLTTIIYVFLNKFYNINSSLFGRRLDYKSFGLMAILVVLAPVIIFGLSLLIRDQFSLPIPLNSQGTRTILFSPVDLLVLVIFGPIYEELVWRGLGVGLLNRLDVPRKMTIIWLGFAFAVFHLPDPLGTFKIFEIWPGAMILTWMRLKSGGLFWPLLFHMSANLLSEYQPYRSLIFSIFAPNYSGP